MTTEQYIDKLNNMVMDINPTEISAQIANDNLRLWCLRWASKMIETIGLVRFINDGDDDE